MNHGTTAQILGLVSVRWEGDGRVTSEKGLLADTVPKIGHMVHECHLLYSIYYRATSFSPLLLVLNISRLGPCQNFQSSPCTANVTQLRFKWPILLFPCAHEYGPAYISAYIPLDFHRARIVLIGLILSH